MHTLYDNLIASSVPTRITIDILEVVYYCNKVLIIQILITDKGWLYQHSGITELRPSYITFAT